MDKNLLEKAFIEVCIYRKELEKVMNEINEAKKIWDKAQPYIKKIISELTYDMFFTKLFPVRITENRLILTTEFEKTKKSIERDYIDIIEKAVKNVDEYIERVDITVGEQITEEEISKELNSTVNIIENEENSIFNKEYTFDNFVVGSSNEIAMKAAQTVAEDPGKNLNPLFIYGGVGLGKTHLMHAIANSILSKNKNAKILYSTTHKFTEDYIKCIRNTKDNKLIEEFTKKYSNVDVLMLDDIQFLNGKQATQETLFHIFNDFLLKEKQIIFTSDRHPKELSEIEERMRSRFLYGLTADIGYPDLETRIAILQKKAYRNKYCISDKVIEYIAAKIDTNIRELEGALKKVVFYAGLMKQEPTIELVNTALKDDIENKNSPITIDIIVDKVCEFFDINKAEITSKKRTKNIVEARQIAIFLTSEMVSVPLATIGEYFGGRDHSTVIHARDKIIELKNDNPIYKNYINDITEMIKKSKY